MRNKSPVVLLIAEGYNISSSWRGNALFNALPETFIDLWHNYPHTLISPSGKPSDFDDEIEFSILGSGSLVNSKREQIHRQIENGKFFANQNKLKFLLNTKKANSALHLFSCLSGKEDSLQILMAYLKAAKLSKCYRTYIHLLIDEKSNDSRSILSKISVLNRKIEKEGFGEIASITGSSNINDQSSAQALQKSLKELILGSGAKALSPEQGLTKKHSAVITLDRFPTTTIFRQNKPVARINNFDSIIFTDSDARAFSKLILSFITPEQGSIRGLTMPRMINVATSFPLFSQEFPRLQNFFMFDQLTFPALLTQQNYSQLYITDSTRIIHFNCFLKVAVSACSRIDIIASPEGKEYLKNIKSLGVLYRKTIKKALDSDEFDFILIDLPFLLHSNLSNQFSKSKESVEEIDEILKDIYHFIKTTNGALIFTSINNRSLFGEEDQLYSPFIFCLDGIGKNKENKSTKEFPNRIIYELLKKKYDMINIAPTILDLFKVKKPETMTGNSLLSSKILT